MREDDVKNGLYYYNDANEIHRDDGPAWIGIDGSVQWCKNGEIHRDDGPAVIKPDRREWYLNDKLHREDGPAIEYTLPIERDKHTGKLQNVPEWYIDGKRVPPKWIIVEGEKYTVGDVFDDSGTLVAGKRKPEIWTFTLTKEGLANLELPPRRPISRNRTPRCNGTVWGSGDTDDCREIAMDGFGYCKECLEVQLSSLTHRMIKMAEEQQKLVDDLKKITT